MHLRLAHPSSDLTQCLTVLHFPFLTAYGILSSYPVIIPPHPPSSSSVRSILIPLYHLSPVYIVKKQALTSNVLMITGHRIPNDCIVSLILASGILYCTPILHFSLGLVWARPLLFLLVRTPSGEKLGRMSLTPSSHLLNPL